jgi:hypothetical protein
VSIATVVVLEDRPCRQSLTGESSAANSSGPSKFVTLVTDLCKTFLYADLRLFEIIISKLYVPF